MKGTYRIAEKNIEIISLYEGVHKLCIGYESEEAPDFTVESAQSDIDFERESRALCLKVFAARELPELGKKERDMLECYLLSTTYGTLEKLYRHRLAEHGEVIDKKAKRRYILRRIFPETEFYKEYSPLAYKYKVLIPFVWAKRLFCAALKNRKNIKKEIDMVKKIK